MVTSCYGKGPITPMKGIKMHVPAFILSAKCMYLFTKKW